MKISGLSPVVEILDQRFRFELRSRDTLAWLVLDRLGPAQQRNLLATCPECLVYGLSRLDDKQPAQVADLIGQLRKSAAASDIENRKVDSRRWSTRARKCYHRWLAKSTEANRTPGSDRRLAEIVADGCRMKPAAVYRWLQATPLDEGFWQELADAALTPPQPAELSVQAGQVSADDLKRWHREKMESMKQLAYGASHEINNPLANIASRAQTLLMDEPDPDRRMRLAKINEQAFRAHEMIADMMLFAHPPRPEFACVDPLQIVQTVIAEMEPRASQQQTQIRVQSCAVEATAADATQLAMAIRALIQNSLDALQQSGTILVEVAGPTNAERRLLEIAVSDDGPGIPTHVMPHLFDPFYCGREAGRGLGFGLSKAWRIAELHDGEILAESPSGGGARFRLRIPCRDVA
jgi:signal transduction histidine kinase